MEEIIEYIKREYAPLSLIVYGSYADGTNNLGSDFDALVISGEHGKFHDTSFVNGVQLDVFVYPLSYFAGDYSCEDFIQVVDGKLIMDSEDAGKNLQQRVLTYIQNRPHKTRAELQSELEWCVKMLERVKRADAEGMFRWHWLLTDSLEIFCDVVQHPYLGPKKTLIWMKEKQPDAFALYEKALKSLCFEKLENWINHIRKSYYKE